MPHGPNRYFPGMKTERRILWVDDEVELLEPHLFFLRERGYTVETSANGMDALALVASQDGRFTVFAWHPDDAMVHAHRVEVLLL